VHRFKTKYANRKKDTRKAVKAVGAVEKTGVRATYKLHDRMLSNPAARKSFKDSLPQLDSDQQDVVEMLRADGLAVVPFTKLFDESLWSELAASSRAFADQIEADLRAEEEPIQIDEETMTKEEIKAARKAERIRERRAGKGGAVRNKQSYLQRSYPMVTDLAFDNPWLKHAASTRMLDVVNTYLELWTKLLYVDQWYTIPVMTDEDARISSQRWHRDYNDQHLVKVFIYMNDVDEGSGPFEYVPGSARGGPYADAWPWVPFGSDLYPPQEEFDQKIPSDAIRTLTGPAGSVIFCNTSGFHRGGFATERPRIMGVYNYISQAAMESLCRRNYSVEEANVPADVPEPVKYALS
jgi:ectoine hydroxylase-related dioxygenase (phytanoyl-CoA dioxygenase family)